MQQPLSRQKLVTHAAGLLVVAALAAIGLRSIANRSGAWSSAVTIKVHFDFVDGLRTGDIVRLQGLRAGQVTRLEPPAAPGSPIVAHLSVDPIIARLLRQDASVMITSQGLIGQPVVELQAGSPGAPAFDPARPLEGKSAPNIGQLTQQAARNLARLETLTQQAEVGLNQINQVTAVVARGEGSLGKLVTSDEAYQKMMSLGRRGETTLDDLQENLESLKQSWLFSRMFQQRGFYDQKTLLFDPLADQYRHGFDAATLFEPNSAVLSPEGRKMLDESISLTRAALTPGSEVVIAAFSAPGGQDEKLLKKLTQAQAESVRDYLENAHSLSYVGLFQWRKVTAVGYGSTRPPNWAEELPGGNRLELVVMTPRTVQPR